MVCPSRELPQEPLRWGGLEQMASAGGAGFPDVPAGGGCVWTLARSRGDEHLRCGGGPATLEAQGQGPAVLHHGRLPFPVPRGLWVAPPQASLGL